MSIYLEAEGYVLEIRDEYGTPIFYAEGLSYFDVVDITGQTPEEIKA